jgi:hypothetical protein
MGVDQPGQHVEVATIHDLGGLSRAEVTHGGDAAVAHAEVQRLDAPGQDGLAAAQNQVEHRQHPQHKRAQIASHRRTVHGDPPAGARDRGGARMAGGPDPPLRMWPRPSSCTGSGEPPLFAPAC